jgi:riboflavin kinase/FMN adenylyltransferase
MPSYLTIGTYDGVHLGHRKIITALIRESLKYRLRSALAYFPEPPKFFFSRETENCLITLPEEREALFRGLGVGRISPIPFTAAVADMSAEKFFNSLILKKYRAEGLCVGRDFAIGKDRLGNLEFLRKRCAEAGVRLKTMTFTAFEGHKISSSLIRSFLRNGHVEAAAECLGRPYSVAGTVIKGAGMGRLLGFPTANAGADPAKILPPGVFAVRVRLGKEVFSGVANVGRRPTLRSLGGRMLLETHILDFDRDIYGRRLEVEFLRHLRAERRFGSRETLRQQIAADVRAARKHGL